MAQSAGPERKRAKKAHSHQPIQSAPHLARSRPPQAGRGGVRRVRLARRPERRGDFGAFAGVEPGAGGCLRHLGASCRTRRLKSGPRVLRTEGRPASSCGSGGRRPAFGAELPMTRIHSVVHSAPNETHRLKSAIEPEAEGRPASSGAQWDFNRQMYVCTFLFHFVQCENAYKGANHATKQNFGLCSFCLGDMGSLAFDHARYGEAALPQHRRIGHLAGVQGSGDQWRNQSRPCSPLPAVHSHDCRRREEDERDFLTVCQRSVAAWHRLQVAGILWRIQRQPMGFAENHSLHRGPKRTSCLW